MSHKDFEKSGQGSLAALLRPLRSLLGAEPTSWQRKRMLDIQKTFDLQTGESIFIIVAILEGYLQLIQIACSDAQRVIRKIAWLFCLVCILASSATAVSVYVVSRLREPALMNAVTEDPTRAFLRATIRRMPDSEIARIASSRHALEILQQLPHMTDEQLHRIDSYMNGSAQSDKR